MAEIGRWIGLPNTESMHCAPLAMISLASNPGRRYCKIRIREVENIRLPGRPYDLVLPFTTRFQITDMAEYLNDEQRTRIRRYLADVPRFEWQTWLVTAAVYGGWLAALRYHEA